MTDINEPYRFVDGLYTTFSPSSIINEEIRKRNINTNRQYREYLQKNASTIMNYNFETVPQVLGNNIPHTFSINDKSRPYGYETSEPKQRFLSEQFLFVNQTRPMRSNYM
jgi:hypothetical protein